MRAASVKTLSRVSLVHLLESVLGKTGLLGRGGMFWEQSGPDKPRELSSVCRMFPEHPLAPSRTLHSRRKTGDFWRGESLSEGLSSGERASDSCLARHEEWDSCKIRTSRQAAFQSNHSQNPVLFTLSSARNELLIKRLSSMQSDSLEKLQKAQREATDLEAKVATASSETDQASALVDFPAPDLLKRSSVPPELRRPPRPC